MPPMMPASIVFPSPYAWCLLRHILHSSRSSSCRRRLHGSEAYLCLPMVFMWWFGTWVWSLPCRPATSSAVHCFGTLDICQLYGHPLRWPSCYSSHSRMAVNLMDLLCHACGANMWISCDAGDPSWICTIYIHYQVVLWLGGRAKIQGDSTKIS